MKTGRFCKKVKDMLRGNWREILLLALAALVLSLFRVPMRMLII